MQRLCAVFECPAVGLIDVRYVNVNCARHRTPLSSRIRQLHKGITDTDGGVSKFSIRHFRPINDIGIEDRQQEIQ